MELNLQPVTGNIFGPDDILMNVIISSGKKNESLSGSG